MTTTITTTSTPSAMVRAQPQSVDKLAFQPSSPDEVLALVDRLVPTGMLPRHIRSPQAALLQVLYGREHGLTMMQSLMHMHVVGNVPAMSVELLAAKVRASPVCRRLAPTEITAERVVVVAERSDTGEQVTCEWTMDDARRAGLANKDNWRHYPKRMLLARATGDAIQALFQDVKQGMAIAEELELVREDRAPGLAEEEREQPAPSTATARLAVQIRAVQAQAPQAPSPAEPEVIDVSPAPPAPLSAPAPAPVPAETEPPAAKEGEDLTTERHAELIAIIRGCRARAEELLGPEVDRWWKNSEHRVERVAGVRKLATMLQRVEQAQRLVRLAELDEELRTARRQVMEQLGEQQGREAIAAIGDAVASAWKLGYDRASEVLSLLLGLLAPPALPALDEGDL